MLTFHELSSAQLRQALQLREQIETLQQKLSALLGGAPSARPAAEKTKRSRVPVKGKRTMSAEARAKIGAAAKARWAKVKAPAAPAAKRAPGKSKKKGLITPEGRAKLSAAMKARWEARKKGAPAPNASA